MRGRFAVRRLMMLAWAIPAWLALQQATAQALPPAVVACMDEHEPTRRLACYDREVPRAVAATRPPGSTPGASAPASQLATAPPTRAPAAGSTPGTLGSGPQPATAPSSGSPPASGATSAAQSTAAEVDAFGMTTQIQRQQAGASTPPHLDKLTARITTVSQQPRGEFVVTLDNGQVWEEAETTSHLPLHTGDDITIKRGMLGAFYMSSHQVLGLRVKRVR
jgi:hypothetical protein